MAKESALWGWLSCARRKMGPKLDINRIENLLGAGTPDVEFYIHDESLPEFVNPQAWLELKSHERPAKPTTPIRFALKERDEQIRWLDRGWKMGRNAYFLLQVGGGSERRLYLAPGSAGLHLKKGLTESQIAVVCTLRGGLVFDPAIDPETLLRKVITCRHTLRLLQK